MTDRSEESTNAMDAKWYCELCRSLGCGERSHHRTRLGRHRPDSTVSVSFESFTALNGGQYLHRLGKRGA